MVKNVQISIYDIQNSFVSTSPLPIRRFASNPTAVRNVQTSVYNIQNSFVATSVVPIRRTFGDPGYGGMSVSGSIFRSNIVVPATKTQGDSK